MCFLRRYFNSHPSSAAYEVTSENNLDKCIRSVLLFNKYLQKNLVLPFSSCSHSFPSLFVFQITLLCINLLLELVFLSAVVLSDGKPSAVLVHKNLCCETAMLYVYVYIATRMALSHKSIKIKSWCTCSIADMGPKKRKNLENEGSAYLPPTCPACTITAKPVHLISWEFALLYSLPQLLFPHAEQRQWCMLAAVFTCGRQGWCGGAMSNWMLLLGRTEAGTQGLWFVMLVFLLILLLQEGILVSAHG